jgi:hypothetical protein
MSQIEILAVVFSVLVLLKIVLFLLSPMVLFKFGKSFLKKSSLLWVVYIVIGAVSGYYVIVNVDAASVGAVFLLASALIGIRLLPLSGKMIKAFESEFSRKKVLEKHWFSLVVWAVLSIWILISVL